MRGVRYLRGGLSEEGDRVERVKLIYMGRADAVDSATALFL